jgi:hypothetical protein
MKQLVKPSNISFAGAVVTLTGVNVPLNQILLVANATTGVIHYSVSGPAPTSYTQATNSQITLATAPTAGDKLTIYYDDALPNSASSAAITPFTSVGASAEILAANANRKAVVFANSIGGSTYYILFGTGTASASNYSLALEAGDTASLSGVLFAFQGFGTGAGNLNVTEIS